jgi:hypothetical protein
MPGAKLPSCRELLGITPNCIAPRSDATTRRGRPASELDDVPVGIDDVRERVTWGVLTAFDETPARIDHRRDRIVEP